MQPPPEQPIPATQPTPPGWTLRLVGAVLLLGWLAAVVYFLLFFQVTADETGIVNLSLLATQQNGITIGCACAVGGLTLIRRD